MKRIGRKTKKVVKKPSKYNVIITVKTTVANKIKAMKMKRDAKKLRGAKVKVVKTR